MSLWRDLFELIVPVPEDSEEIQRQRAQFQAELDAVGVDVDELERWERAGLPVNPRSDGYKQNLAKIRRLKAAGIDAYHYREFTQLGLTDMKEMQLLISEKMTPDLFRDYLSNGVTSLSDIRRLHKAAIGPFEVSRIGNRSLANTLRRFRHFIATGLEGSVAWSWAVAGASDTETVRRLVREGVEASAYQQSAECGITDVETIVRLSRARIRPSQWISVGVHSPQDMIEFTSLNRSSGPNIYARCIEAGIADRREIRILLAHDITYPEEFADCGIRNVDYIVRMHDAGISNPKWFFEAGVNQPDDMIDLARRGVKGHTLLSFVQCGLEDLNRIERFIAVGCTAEFWSELSGILDDDSIAELASIALSASELNRWPVKLLRRFGLLDPDSWRRFARAHGAAEAPPSASNQHVGLEQLGKVLQDAVDRGERNLSSDEVLRRGPGIARDHSVNASMYSYVKDDGWDAGEAAASLNSRLSAERRRAEEYRRLHDL